VGVGSGFSWEMVFVGYVNCRRMVGVCCGNGGEFVGVDSVN
jgi:hypothetical protein